MITIKYERKCEGGWMGCEELYVNTHDGMRSVIVKAINLSRQNDVRNIETFGASGQKFNHEDLIWMVI